MAVFLVTTTCQVWAQKNVEDPKRRQPSVATSLNLLFRPFVFGGLTLDGDRYKIFAGHTGTGIDVETKSLAVLADVTLPNSRWAYSRTGYILSSTAFVAHRTGKGLYFGGNPVEQRCNRHKRVSGMRPFAVAGKDTIKSQFSMRIQVTYFLPALDHSKDRPGGEIALWLPSQATPHHVFFCMAESINQFTPIPGSSNHEDFLSFRVVWRF
jgi:hypothetical protein